MTSFLRKLGPKMIIFRGFTEFFQNYWIAIKVINIIELIESGCGFGATFGSDWVQCCEKCEEPAIINRFLTYFV